MRKFRRFSPNLIILDVTLPMPDGIGTLKEMRRIKPNAKVVMLARWK